jgi:uncharacterized membrane protein
MNKNRLEAFSDGVLAIIITIMVLELKMPRGTDWNSIKLILPTLSSYVLSFVFIGIYWGNHHHLLHTANKVNGKIIWANHHLLFWLSLVPFATMWMGENNFSSVPVAIYGGLLVLCGIAFTILARAIVSSKATVLNDPYKAFHKTDVKAILSTVLYISTIPLAFIEPLISCTIYIIVALMWIIPDKEVEKILSGEG